MAFFRQPFLKLGDNDLFTVGSQPQCLSCRHLLLVIWGGEFHVDVLQRVLLGVPLPVGPATAWSIPLPRNT